MPALGVLACLSLRQSSNLEIWAEQEEANKELVEAVSGQVERQKDILERSVSSCEKYCEALKCVEDYINARWGPWRDEVDTETRRLVTVVSELYAFAEQTLGDLIDRKQSQVLTDGCAVPKTTSEL